MLKHRVVLTLGGGAEVRRQGSGERRDARPGPEGRDLPRLGDRRGGATGGVRGGHVGGERAGADRHRNLRGGAGVQRGGAARRRDSQHGKRVI